MDEAQAAVIAQKLDEGLDDFFATNPKGKVMVIKHYLDQQIGNEPKAEIRSIAIPGVPFEISGKTLETATDMALEAVATLIVNKWFGGVEA